MLAILKLIVMIFMEILFVLLGVAVVLGVSALSLRVSAPIRSEYYAYYCIATALIGFVVWFALILTIFRHRISASLVPAGMAVLACSLAFQVIVPVTIERSITVFLLSEMAQEPVRPYSEKELEDKLAQNYLAQRHVLDKRLKENAISRTIEQMGGQYRLTQRGAQTVWYLQHIGRFFSVPQVEIATTDLSDPAIKR